MRRFRLPGTASLRVYGYAVVAEVALATASAAVAAAPSRLEVSVAHALAARLPKTHISSVVCGRTGDMCEVAAGSTLFYTDQAARFLVIGRVYDMKTRTDLTAARLLAINPDLLVNGAAHRDDLDEAPPTKASSAKMRVVPSAALLKGLPANGAIAWGPVNGPRVIVFSDFRCPYCARLSQTLVELGARVEERPISVLGTRALSEAVLCSAAPEAALHAAYTGNRRRRATPGRPRPATPQDSTPMRRLRGPAALAGRPC